MEHGTGPSRPNLCIVPSEPPPPEAGHILEKILANRATRLLLGVLTKSRTGGKCLFERWCENYDNPGLSRFARWRWKLPGWAIDVWLKKAKLDREMMKAKLFHHVPTVKALAMTGRSIARYGLSTPQRFAAPLLVVWNFTQACNLRCRHCYQDARSKPLPGEMTLDERIDLVDQMGDLTVPFVAFAGGEPLISKHIWPVMERCRKRQIHMSVATNGTLLTPEVVARLIESGVKYVEVSVDSLDPAQHDEFRGVPGAWERSVQGIRNLVAAGMRTGLAMCFTRETVRTVDDAVQFAVDLGCRTFSHFNFIPVGRGRQMCSEDITPAQREWLLERLTHHLQQGRISILSTAPQFGRGCLQYAPPDGIFPTGHAGTGRGTKTMVLARYIGGCGTGRCYCAVQPSGRVTPCVYLHSETIGNLRQQRLAEIWQHPLCAMLSDRRNLGDHCGICKYRAYCGGCRARSLAYTGDILCGDPGCIYNLHRWNQLAGSDEANALPQLLVSQPGRKRSSPL